MSGGPEREKKIGLLILTVFIAVTDYLWSFWYFRSRHSTGTLLSISQVSAENLGNMLFQNVAVNLITLLTAAILWLILRRDFGKILGFGGGNRRGHLAAGIAGGIYALLLVAALVWSGISVLALVYQWICLLVGCPLADFAKAHGYMDILPQLCAADVTAAAVHARLIRHHTVAQGYETCDYWYVGERNTEVQ